MKRSDLEKRAIQELEDEGYICERAYNKAVFIPGKGYIGKRFDFFHVIDIIALKGSTVRWIQVTSEAASKESKHHSRNGSDSGYNHRKKIEEYWTVDMPLELWVYEKVQNRWCRRIEIYQHRRWETQTICDLLMEEGEQ